MWEIASIASGVAPVPNAQLIATFGNNESDLQQLAVNPGCPPVGVLFRQPLHQSTDILGDPRMSATRSGTPAPVGPEIGAVPHDDGLGLQDHEEVGPARPRPAEHGPEAAIQGVRYRRGRSAIRTPVPLDLNASLAVFECHLQNLVGQVPIGFEFIQHLGEEFSLEPKVHTGRRIKADQPRMEWHTGKLALRTSRFTRSTEVVAVSGHQHPVLGQQEPLQFPVLPA